MIPNVVWVAPLDGYRLHLRFDDGVEGTFDLPPRVEFTGVFEPLRDPAFFAQVTVDPQWFGPMGQTWIRWCCTQP